MVLQVKMDMAAIETLSHDGLVQALVSDVRGADEAEFATNSAEIALTSGDSSSGVSFSSTSNKSPLTNFAYIGSFHLTLAVMFSADLRGLGNFW